MDNFRRLVDIMARLRGPDGCPWDKAQDHQSLKPYIVEETYEVLDAIDKNCPQDLSEELGDLLLQIVFHSQIANEKSAFSIDDVCRKISDKLIKRHPHIFSEQTTLTPQEVLNQWEEIKRDNNLEYSALEGIPKTLPALLKAYRIQEKVGRLGFDWKDISGVTAKIKEEIEEFVKAASGDNKEEMSHELGDLLFTIVNLSRHLGLSAEEALEYTNKKFIKRFQYIEQSLAKQGKTTANSSLEEMDVLWEESKKTLA
jgi:tetrapyrrole methylase family protein / MazG family protein